MADETEKRAAPEADKAAKARGERPEGRPDKAKRADKGGAAKAEKAAAAPREPEPKVPARLKLRYQNEIVPYLMRELKIDNRYRVPRLDKIVINMALNEARDNVKVLDAAVEELKLITGQKPVITRARKAISNFKLRKGMPIGAMVTLRRERMYEFLDRLVNVALPRVRDFRGLSEKAFDGRGNYSLGLREHTIFAELPLDKVERLKGLTISIVSTARSDFEGQTLLRALGVPLRGGPERAAAPAGEAAPPATEAATPAN